MFSHIIPRLYPIYFSIMPAIVPCPYYIQIVNVFPPFMLPLAGEMLM